METLSFTEAMRHHLLLILIIEGAFLIHIRSWPVEMGSRENGKSINTNIVHTKYIFGNNKLKNVLKRLFRENKETYLKTTGDEVSIKIRSDTFQHFMKGTKMWLKGKYILEPEGKDEKEYISLSNNVAQYLEIKWFNRMN